MGSQNQDKNAAWHCPNSGLLKFFSLLLLTKSHHPSSFFDLCIVHEIFSLRLLWCGVCDLPALLYSTRRQSKALAVHCNCAHIFCLYRCVFPVGAREIRMVVNDLFIPTLEVDGCYRIIFEEHSYFVVYDDPPALTNFSLFVLKAHFSYQSPSCFFFDTDARK